MQYTQMYNVHFEEYTVFGHTVGFLKMYYTRTYNIEYTIFGHIVCFLKEHYTRTYSMVLKLYCIRTYNMMFENSLYSDV